MGKVINDTEFSANFGHFLDDRVYTKSDNKFTNSTPII